MKITHVISGLRTGGAESMLEKLLQASDRSRFEAEVVSLTDVGAIGERIAATGVPVRALGMRRGRSQPLGLMRLTRWLRHDPPAVVQTWLYHADLVGGMAAMLAGRIPVIWNLRHSDLEAGSSRATVWTVRACARLARRLPARIVSCSEAGRQVHGRLGYPAERIVVIPNGFDLERFRPDPVARERFRREARIPGSVPVVGVVARHHPQKDHITFLAAARRLVAEGRSIHFLLCGPLIDRDDVAAAVREAGLVGHCTLLGRRDDVERIHAAVDVVCSSSSSGEGFPNVIGEAMACGVPCVVTDVGDSARIVGDTGRVVPRRDPAALAAALGGLLDLDPGSRRKLGEAARRRIARHFSLGAVVARYERLYTSVVDPAVGSGTDVIRAVS